jgi:hypothetical protein
LKPARSPRGFSGLVVSLRRRGTIGGASGVSRRPAVRGQKSEVRGQRAEGRGQKRRRSRSKKRIRKRRKMKIRKRSRRGGCGLPRSSSFSFSAS